MYIQYLLGQLTEADRALLEERFFEDDQAFAQLNLTEDELIEDYLFDRLSPEAHAQFEAFYLPLPAHQQKVKLAKALHQASEVDRFHSPNPASAPQPVSPSTSDTLGATVRSIASRRKLWVGSPMSQLALAASILLSLFGLWLVYSLISSTKPVPQQGQKPQPAKEPPSVPSLPEPSQTPDPLAHNPGEKPEPKPAPISPKPKPDRGPISPGAIASLMLLPSLSRGNGQEKQLTLTPETKQVRLELVILDDENTQTAIAVVKQPDGAILWNSNPLPVKTLSTKRSVHLKLAPAHLTAQTCVIELHPAEKSRQSEVIATYTFKVLRVESASKN